MVKKVLVVLGHPYSKSYCNCLAEAYAEGAEDAGADVEVLRLGELKFDPNLKWGYSKIQKLEPDLVKAQKLIKRAEHLVFIYPIWWGAMPALMKGFIDRIFLPGFAYKFKEGTMAKWDKLLSGKSAHLIMTLGAPSFVYRFLSGAPGTKLIKNDVLGFCGVKPVKVTLFGSVEAVKDEKRKAWIGEIREKGKRLL